MDLELQEIKESDNNNDPDGRSDEVCPENGSCSNENTPGPTEGSHLLQESDVVDSNGAHCIVGNIPEDLQQNNDKHVGTLGRLKKELNEPGCWKLKVWMILLIVFILIFLLIFLSVYFCSVHVEDADDQYNTDEFVVPRSFKGNFTVLNKAVTLDAQQKKLTHIYASSHALGRYFSRVTVNQLSNSSVTYNLTFVMPVENRQLTLYTLSKEVVYNVLLQELYDQDTEDALYIVPSSVTMEVVS